MREEYLAFWRTELRNAPHFARTDKKAWTVDDFLLTADAAARRKQRDLEALKNARELVRANAALAAITKETEEGLPSWAKKHWG